MAEFPIKSERDLLDRIAYSGPLTDRGHGYNHNYTWSGAVTDAELWMPTTGNRFVVSLITINASTKCTVTIFDDDNTDIDVLYKGVIAADSTIVIPYPIPRASVGVNRALRITTSGAGGYAQVWGWEGGTGVESTTTSESTSSSSETTSSESTSSSSETTSSESTSSSSETTSSESTSSSSETTSSSSSSTSSQTTSSSSSSTSSETTSSESTSSESTSSTTVSITYL